MRIAISMLGFRPGRIGGTETYLRKMVPELTRALSGHDVVLVWPRGANASFDAPETRHVAAGGSASGLIASRFVEALSGFRSRGVERVFHSIAPDVTLFPQQSIFPKHFPGKAVLVAHDVQHLVLPQNVGLADRLFRWGIYNWSMRRADRIVSISGFTKRQIVDRCGVPAQKIVVIPHGFEPINAATVAPWNGGPSPYLYYPAATYPHKDHATLLRTFARLCRSNRDWPFHLVLSGEQTSHWRSLRRLIRQLGVDERVSHVGFVPYQQVLSLYKGCHAVVFSSQYEGFGLPILEAVSMGKRVVARRLEVFDEIGLPREDQIDFEDAEQMRAAVMRQGPTVLRHEPITWPEHARRLAQILCDAP